MKLGILYSFIMGNYNMDIRDSLKNMFKAIELHIEGLKEDNLPIPESTAIAEYLVVQ